jgi:hypothetical protein
MKNKIAVMMLIPVLSYASVDQFPIETLKGFHIKEDYLPKTQNRNVFQETKQKDEVINFLLNMNRNYQSPKEFLDKKYQFDSEFIDTGLKFNLYEIKLSIPYFESPILKQKAYGYAPIGGYENGWSGIKTFFKDPSLGSCSYSYEKFIWAEVGSSHISYIINGHPSFHSIKGNKNVGYLYRIKWDIDQKEYLYHHEIECANKIYSQEIMDNLISFAKSIAS